MAVKLVERISLATACLWVMAGLAVAQSLQGTLSKLPDSHPQKCHDVVEKRRVDDDDHVRNKAWEILQEWGYISAVDIWDTEKEYSFRANTRDKMVATGTYCTIQRLEVTGIWTNDDA